MGTKPSEKLLDTKISSWLSVIAGLTLCVGAHEQSGGVKELLQNQLAEKKFVSLGVGRFREIREYLEMWLLDVDGPPGGRAIL